MENTKKPLGYRLWFKIVLTLMLFIPAFAVERYDPTRTSEVITAVLADPWIVAIPWFLPLAKLVLLGVILLPLLLGKSLTKTLLAYYGVMLVVVGIFQNMAVTESYGYTWLLGNTIAQFTVAAYCFYGLLRRPKRDEIEHLSPGRLWLIIPMLFAFLMPYGIDAQGTFYPSLSLSVLTNEAAVTYCMITPVVIGMFLLFPQGIYNPLLSVISYVGLLYGLFNMLTWFVLDSQQWWMGILHLPLLIISFYGLLQARRKARS